LYLDIRVRSEFEGRRFALPARIYARPLELHAGLRIAQIDVVRELQEAGYTQGPREASRAGSRKRQRLARGGGAAVRVLGRDAAGEARGARLRQRRGEGGAGRGRAGAAARAPGASGDRRHLPANNEDRVLVRLSEVPKQMVQALIANEDRNFYAHHGFDLARDRARGLLLLHRPRPPGRQHAGRSSW